MGKPPRGQFVVAVLAVVILGGCANAPAPDKQAEKAAAPLDKIQGKVQVMEQAFGSADTGLNEGKPAVYLWQGVRRYSLFFRKRMDVKPGDEYIVEGVDAQKLIDEIGDPDAGRNGYPLASSCERAVRAAWSGLSFDEVDGRVSALRNRVKRYPARPVFLVTSMRPATAAETAASADPGAGAKAKDDNVPEVPVAAEKQRESLIAGQSVLTAPLWEPAGGTVRCQVVIDGEGKVSELGTGMQLCEAVPWSQFQYRPLVRAGHPVKVKTEVEVSFKPRT